MPRRFLECAGYAPARTIAVAALLAAAVAGCRTPSGSSSEIKSGTASSIEAGRSWWQQMQAASADIVQGGDSLNAAAIDLKVAVDSYQQAATSSSSAAEIAQRQKAELDKVFQVMTQVRPTIDKTIDLVTQLETVLKSPDHQAAITAQEAQAQAQLGADEAAGGNQVRQIPLCKPTPVPEAPQTQANWGFGGAADCPAGDGVVELATRTKAFLIDNILKNVADVALGSTDAAALATSGTKFNQLLVDIERARLNLVDIKRRIDSWWPHDFLPLCAVAASPSAVVTQGQRFSMTIETSPGGGPVTDARWWPTEQLNNFAKNQQTPIALPLPFSLPNLAPAGTMGLIAEACNATGCRQCALVIQVVAPIIVPPPPPPTDPSCFCAGGPVMPNRQFGAGSAAFAAAQQCAQKIRQTAAVLDDPECRLGKAAKCDCVPNGGAPGWIIAKPNGQPLPQAGNCVCLDNQAAINVMRALHKKRVLNAAQQGQPKPEPDWN